MNKKIGLYIGGRRFDIDIDDEFATFLENKMSKDFNIDGNNDLKVLVQAYVRKNHEIYLQEEKIKKFIDIIDNLE
jgi:hypothetical protein